MHSRTFIEAIKQRPIAVWLLLLYLIFKFFGLAHSAISWQQDVFSGAPINGPIGLAIYTANAVLFMTLLVGSSLFALWNRSKFGLIVSCLIACLYFYRSVLLDIFGGPITVYLDETGVETTDFLHVYGARLYQLLLLVLATIPLWSKAARKYVGWHSWPPG